MSECYLARLFSSICKVRTPDELLAVASEAVAMHPLSAQGEVEAYCHLNGCQPVVLFGAGRFAKSVLEHWVGRGYRPIYCVDSNPRLWGASLLDIPIVSPQALYDHVPPPIVVVAAMITGDIEMELAAHGLSCLFAERDGEVGYLPGSHLLNDSASLNRLWDILADDASRRVLLAAWKARLFQSLHFEMIGSPFLHHVYTGPQYFVDDIFNFDNHETWVDCGAYDGDFLVSGHAFMLDKGRGRPRIHALEADAINLVRLKNTVSDYALENVHFHHVFVGGEDGSYSAPNFNACRDSDAVIEPVRRVRLDTLFSGTPLHFIKMDIEGAEFEALKGAANVINVNQPKLAVCIYHETRHLIEIPLLIYSQVPNYKLYVRHHSSSSLWETVCYGMPG